MSDYLMNVPTVALDIETVPNTDVKVLADNIDIQAPKNYKDAAKIEAYIEEKRLSIMDDLVKECSLHPVYGKICSIAVDIDGSEAVFYGYDEKQILEEFIAEMPERYRLLTFNGIGFDVPFINTRLGFNGLGYRVNEVPKFDKDQHIDLFLRLNNYGGFKCANLSTGLKAICKHLGVDHPDTDGSKVYEYYSNNDIESIGIYNMRDVRATRELAYRAGLLGLEVTA